MNDDESRQDQKKDTDNESRDTREIHVHINNDAAPAEQLTSEKGDGTAAESSEEVPLWPEIRKWLRDLLIAATLCILLIVYVIQPFRVEKTSMEPLLYDGDRILVSKISLLLEPIERGDVVVLWNPRNPEESWIKRVIGMPGEKVQIVDGIVYINGYKLEEPYIPEEERKPPKNHFPSRNAEWLAKNYPDRMREFGYVVVEEWLDTTGLEVALRVPEGYYFVCGDHRRFSMDSRDSIFPIGHTGPGLIPQKYIYGKAFMRYWPLEEFGFIEHPDYDGFEPTENSTMSEDGFE